MLLVRNGIAATRRQDLESEAELLWVELVLSSTTILLGVFYRPPSQSLGPLQQLQHSLSSISDSRSIVLCGDFNAPGIQWDTVSPTYPSAVAKSLCDITLDHSLSQMVPEPTRINNLLDLVLTNNCELIQDVNVVDGIPGGDHDAVDFTINCGKRPVSQCRRLVYNFKKADWVLFKELLGKIPWDCCFLTDSVEDAWTQFKDLLFTVADQCIPKFHMGRKAKGWLSNETLLMIRRKRRAFILAKRTKTTKDRNRYKRLTNLVRDMTRNDHRQHLESITNNLHIDQKPFWRWLKSLRGGASLIPDIHSMGQTLSRSIDKAMALNSFFTSVFTKENVSTVSQARKSLDTCKSNQSIDNITFDETEVYTTLCKLDPQKASGPDGVPGRLLREGALELHEPLCKIFNLSLQRGQLPMDWKRANISPIFKKGSKHDPSNYRPVSLTSIAVKVMERCVHKKAIGFLNDHYKLNSNQHGFRQNHSCQTQLIETIHQWAKELDARRSVHAVFLDFAKAFDSVPHQRLLIKLDHIGLRGPLLKWISNFLSGREQRVVIDGHYSTWRPATSGVPQGSILGPLLFLVYINDIGDNLKCETRLFADDCILWQATSGKDDNDALQNDLNRLLQWSRLWQLPFNIAKCKALRFSTKKTASHSHNYRLNNTNLQWVDTFSYLGVKLHSTLKWEGHVKKAVGKATNILNLLKRNMNGCTRNSKVCAYKALVQPHLEYSCAAWNPYEKKNIDHLERVQKRAARWITAKWVPEAKKWSKSYETSLNELSWLTLQDRRSLLSLCQMYKIVNRKDCIDFHRYYSFNPSNSTRSHTLSILCMHARLNIFRYSFFINNIHLWNKLPLEIVSAPSLDTFKYRLKSFLRNRI